MSRPGHTERKIQAWVLERNVKNYGIFKTITIVALTEHLFRIYSYLGWKVVDCAGYFQKMYEFAS